MHSWLRIWWKPRTDLPEGFDYFQEQLQRHLYQRKTSAAVKQALLADPKLVEFYEYIAGFDLHMLDVGRVLSRKWSEF